MHSEYRVIAEHTQMNVVGTSGSGKTTVSQSLSRILQIEHIEMDSIFWGANWSWPSDDDFFAHLQQALAQDAWVLDGNYTRTIPIKWKHVEVVIWLDYSFLRTMQHAITRAMTRSMTQEELWEGTGNRESFRRSFFSTDSILLWTMKTHSTVRQKYERLMHDAHYSDIRFIRFRSPQATHQALSSLKQHISSEKP